MSVLDILIDVIKLRETDETAKIHTSTEHMDSVVDMKLEHLYELDTVRVSMTMLDDIFRELHPQARRDVKDRVYSKGLPVDGFIFFEDTDRIHPSRRLYPEGFLVFDYCKYGDESKIPFPRGGRRGDKGRPVFGFISIRTVGSSGDVHFVMNTGIFVFDTNKKISSLLPMIKNDELWFGNLKEKELWIEKFDGLEEQRILALYEYNQAMGRAAANTLMSLYHSRK